VWESAVDGQRLRFRLVGINNQNFIMGDDRTNTWWQQVNGRAILGPMKGKQLKLIPADSVSFETWRADHPDGRVLAPDPDVEQRDGDYLPTSWEREMASVRTVTPLPKKSSFTARQLVVGVKIDSVAKAWGLEDLQKARVQLDVLGSTPLMIVVAEDGKSVRVFDRRIDGREAEFIALLPENRGRDDFSVSATSGREPEAGSAPAVQKAQNQPDPIFLDVETGSEWDFAGRAISGPLKGKTLTRVAHLLEYWFDWHTYNPKTLVHQPWNPVKPKPDPLTIPRPRLYEADGAKQRAPEAEGKRPSTKR
jgi:hypothetical protein